MLDRVEEWMGKRHPEVMDPSDDATGTGAAAEEGGDEWVKVRGRQGAGGGLRGSVDDVA